MNLFWRKQAGKLTFFNTSYHIVRRDELNNNVLENVLDV